MADPFSGLGIASNIISVVDFSWKLLSSAKEIHNSSAGNSADNALVKVIAEDVRRLGSKISAQEEPDKDLRRLADEAKRLADDLLVILKKLEAKNPNSRWDSFRAAMRDVWSHRQINDLQDKISWLQGRITVHVHLSISNEVSNVSTAIKNLTDTSKALRLDTKRLGGIERSVEDILRISNHLKSDEQRRQTSEQHAPLESELKLLSSALSNLRSKGSTATMESELLSSLYFQLLQMRHEKIETAHADTCSWVFKATVPQGDQPLYFYDWLQNHNGVFWVKGKPGSGKSTLMKFVCDNPLTLECLQHWADSYSRHLQARVVQDETFDAETSMVERHRDSLGQDNDSDEHRPKLVTAKYYFWNAGSRLQKSQAGLLRTLLFEVLRQCPELVPHVCRARAIHRGLCDEDTADDPAFNVVGLPWSTTELLAVMESAIRARPSVSFCFFIDGLDEYEEEDKETFSTLISVLNHMSELPNVKLCVSSRPWTIFIDAFTNIGSHTLKLEDLTRGDIHKYVSDKFQQHKQYQRLSAHDKSYATLVDEVTTRAQGVFLWVYLVVRDLLEGLTYHDTVENLMYRLKQFPEDMEDFFQHMIDSIPKVYRAHTARAFMVAMEAPGPQYLMMHSFLDDLAASPLFLSGRGQLPLSDSETAFRDERMRRQLEGRTKGLLEITPTTDSCLYFGSRVDFLHRTERDFLKSSSKLQGIMGNGKQYGYELWVLLCRGILVLIRCAPTMVSRDLAVQIMDDLVSEFGTYAERILLHKHQSSEVVELYKQLESAYMFYGEPWAYCPHDTIVRDACQKGLVEFLEQSSYDWSSKVNVAYQGYHTLLQDVVSSHTDLHGCVVEFLLSKGADPNETGGDSWPVLVNALHKVLCGDWSTAETEVSRVLRALITHGADTQANQPGDVNAEEVILGSFASEQAGWILGRSAFKATSISASIPGHPATVPLQYPSPIHQALLSSPASPPSNSPPSNISPDSLEGLEWRLNYLRR